MTEEEKAMLRALSSDFQYMHSAVVRMKRIMEYADTEECSEEFRSCVEKLVDNSTDIITSTLFSG